MSDSLRRATRSTNARHANDAPWAASLRCRSARSARPTPTVSVRSVSRPRASSADSGRSDSLGKRAKSAGVGSRVRVEPEGKSKRRMRPSSAGSTASRSSSASKFSAPRRLSVASTEAPSTQVSRITSALTSRAASVEASRAPSINASRVASTAPTPAISAVSSPRRHGNHANRLDFEPSRLQVVLDSLLPVDGASWSRPAQPVVPPALPPPLDSVHVAVDIPPLPVTEMLPSPCSVSEDLELQIPALDPVEPPSIATNFPIILAGIADSEGEDFTVVLPSAPVNSTPPKSARNKFDVGSPDKLGCARSARRGFAKRVLGVGHSPILRSTLARLASARRGESHDIAPAQEKSILHDEQHEFFEETGRMVGSQRQQPTPDEIRRGSVGDGPQALLWELRCRLASAGVRLQASGAFRRASELARRRPETAVEKAVAQIERLRLRLQRRRRSRSPWAECVSKTDANDLVEICNVARAAQPARQVMNQGYRAAEVSRTMTLSHEEWTQLCVALDFRPFEIERLFSILDGGSAGGVNLCRMFSMLRAVVAPDISLERFASRVMARYGSATVVYDSFCQTSSMGWPEFCALTEALDVNASNAQKFWYVLVRTGLSPVDFVLEEDEVAEFDASGSLHRNISKDIFEQQLQAWMPLTAVDTLMDQLLESFGSVGQSLHALEQTGLERDAWLTPARLDAALHAVGIFECDSDRILTSLSPLREDRAMAEDHGFLESTVPSTGMTLDSMMQAMSFLRTSRRRGREEAKVVVSDCTLPLWKQLRSLQSDLSRGLHSPRLQAPPMFQDQCEVVDEQRSGWASPFAPLYSAVVSLATRGRSALRSTK